MIIEQLYTKCLAQGAYYIESNGEAAVIDPLRDVETYTSLAEKHNARIVYVFETHFHADFVSGHIDLAAKTNATIVYGPDARPGFPALVARDNEVFTLGHLTITVLHTPGHTPESACFLLKDNNGKAIALFTGDTLFIGDVGRPDLAQKATGLSTESLAGMLYDSIQQKILPLSDDVVIYPGHGAGSACGKNMCAETTDTLGHQRATNYALRPGITKEEFVSEVTAGLPTPPGYFAMDATLNRMGYEHIDTVIARGMTALDADACSKQLLDKNVLALDTRCPESFCKAHIPGSINIGLDGQFAPWAGTLLPDLKRPMLIVADPGREKEALTRLARVGHDNVIGYLANGFDAWLQSDYATASIETISTAMLAGKAPAHCIDVRDPSDYRKAHLPGALNLPLATAMDATSKLDPDETYYVYCTSGYRSVVFISMMKAKGWHRFVNVIGGMNAISREKDIHLEVELAQV